MKGVKSSPAIHIHIYVCVCVCVCVQQIHVRIYKTHRERHAKTNDKERMPLSGKFNIPCFCMM